MKQTKCPQVKLMDEDCYDSHSGQLYCRIGAYDKNSDNYLGKIDYSIFEEKTYVDMIEVEKKFRRCGIASRMMKKLEKENQSCSIIDWEGLSEEGELFIKKYYEVN